MDFLEPVLKRIELIFKAWIRRRYWNAEAVLLRRIRIDDSGYDEEYGQVVIKELIDDRVVATNDKDVIEAYKSEGYKIIHTAKRKALIPDEYIKEKAKIRQ
jgi:rRNA-processing protein FCF1